MAARLKRPCRNPTCPALTVDGWCEAHRPESRQYDRQRGTAHQRGYGARWQRYRSSYLKRNPLCVACLAQGRTTLANEVDHIEAVRAGGNFWSPANHQALCKSCHSSKTARERLGKPT